MDEFDCCELISVLNPRAVDQSRIMVQYGLPSDLTIYVVGRLSKISIQASCLARLKYADMQNLRVHLHNLLIDRIRKIYPDLKIVNTVSFADLAIMEVCDPRACRWCRGVKWFPEMDEHGHPTGKHITCGGCGGDGEHKWHDSERMHRLGISEKMWKNKYMDIYSRILETVWGWDREVRDVMS